MAYRMSGINNAGNMAIKFSLAQPVYEASEARVGAARDWPVFKKVKSLSSWAWISAFCHYFLHSLARR